jgi:hypothetical protein
MACHKLRTDSQIQGLAPGRHGDGDGTSKIRSSTADLLLVR